MTESSYPDVQLFIAGQWRDGSSGETLPVHDPATGLEVGRVAVARQADLDAALAAAAQGFETWKRVPAADRAKLMREAARLFRERADRTARLLTQEQGKPLAEAKAEVLFGAEIIEWFAEEGKRVAGRIVAPRSEGTLQQVFKEPVGPVAAFTPWNFPINQVVRKLCGALTTGCSIVIKAPEETPASPAELVRAFVDAGVPAGVIGLVYGDPAAISSYLIPHPVIRKVTFTGSTPVGKQLAALAGAHMKRVTMELGGHAPVIVAEDADVARAAKVAAAAKFRNAGQVCISPTRFIVANSVREAFVAGLVEASRGLSLGHGLETGTTLGPLANPRRVAAMERLTADAVQRGATVATGGERIGSAGNFFAPTVLVNVPGDSLVLNEEPFGPLAAVRGFDTLDEALAEANRLPWGLAAYAFTTSLKTAHALTHGVQAGMLWINQPAPAWPEMPFGGIKDSGYGSEGGPEALEAYLNTKSVSTFCG
ncbi:NAD-dependent succinate-semialdehyde dehydrogenase [Ideonella sp. A 288]|uniref:NAD-dependent succinate-semialdehyde dehydrogenase n=1 Tax=Ideonella sp. A 288 TaxID=1962181 RepID=UPI000B4BB1C8|nr:NAD-dependent succinate-semialdehyde dehydrogenase [Ideonella sp. A 288]